MPIQLRKQRITRVLGFELADSEIEDILGRLGMDLVTKDKGWHIVPPSYRFDIRIEEDLIEELGRVWGYERIPSKLPAMNFAVVPAPESQLPMQRIKHAMVDLGYQEAITYTFVEEALLKQLEPGRQPVALANPISADMSHMRTSIWAGLLKAAQHNVNRQQTRLRLFETGLVFEERDGIQQHAEIGALAYGALSANAWWEKSRLIDFFDLKGDLEALLRLAGRQGVFEFSAAEHPALHPGQSAAINCEGEPAGFIGALHPTLQKQLGFASPVYLFNLKLGLIQQATVPEFKELSKFPVVNRDLAVIIDENTPAKSILDIVRKESGGWLVDTAIFDVYQGDNLEPGYKSVAFGVTLQHPERTLRDEEVNETIGRIVAGLKQQLDIILRE